MEFGNSLPRMRWFEMNLIRLSHAFENVVHSNTWAQLTGFHRLTVRDPYQPWRIKTEGSFFWLYRPKAHVWFDRLKTDDILTWRQINHNLVMLYGWFCSNFPCLICYECKKSNFIVEHVNQVWIYTLRRPASYYIETDTASFTCSLKKRDSPLNSTVPSILRSTV